MKKVFLLFTMFFLVVGFKLKTPIIAVDLVNFVSLLLTLTLIFSKKIFFSKSDLYAFKIIAMSLVISFITLLSIVFNDFISFELVSFIIKIPLFTLAAYSLVLLYKHFYRSDFKTKVLLDLFLAISIHSIIIIFMYIIPDARELIYKYSDISDLEKLKFTGSTRVAGFTGGGGALSSLLQATALILFFYLRKVLKLNTFQNVVFNLLNIITVFSIIIVGRTGLYLLILSLPYILYSLYGLHLIQKVFRIIRIKYLIIFSVLFMIVILVINSQSEGIVEKFIEQSFSRAINVSYGFEKKKTNAITVLYEMIFIPDISSYQYLIGTSTTGRMEKLWLDSDIGYMRLFYAYGILFLFVLTPYLYILLESIKNYRSIYSKLLFLFTILMFIVNLKELMFFGRHLFMINLLLFFVTVSQPSYLLNSNK